MNPKRLVQNATKEQRQEILLALTEFADEMADDAAKTLELVAASDYHVEIKEELANWGKHRGLDFGIKALDDMTLGMTDGEILLLSGDSNHGKSQLAFNMAYQQARQGKLVFFITLEMTKPQAGSRLAKIAMQDGMSFEEAMGLLAFVVFQKVDKLDYRMVYPIVLRAKQAGAGIVFLDHIHYFSRSAQANKTNEVAAISLEIKRAALSCMIPIVALCQCRKLDDGNGKSRKPTKQDLKDAAELYQDCDICIMVWRDKDSLDGNHDLVEARIWKNRLRAMRQEHLIKNFRSEDGAILREINPSRVVNNPFPTVDAKEKHWFDQPVQENSEASLADVEQPTKPAPLF